MSTHLEGSSPNATVIVLVLVSTLHTTCLPACLRTPQPCCRLFWPSKGIPGVPIGTTVYPAGAVYQYHGLLTPYATGPGVIIYGCGYVKSKDYSRLGAIFGVIYISTSLLVGWPILAMWN
ncbi:anion permease [Escherichia coli]